MTCRTNNSNTRRSRYDCIIEAHESTRTRILGKTEARDHKDLAVEHGFIPLTHYNLAHKPIPIPRGMNMPDAKAAVEKDWEKFDKLPAWQVAKVKSETCHRKGAKKEMDSSFCHADGLMPPRDLGVINGKRNRS